MTPEPKKARLSAWEEGVAWGRAEGFAKAKEMAAEIVDGCGCSDKNCKSAWGAKAEKILAMEDKKS